MESMPCYEYDRERFVTRARVIGGRSIGVTIPIYMRSDLGIRPGTKVMVKIRVLKEGDGSEVSEDDFRGPLPADLRRGN